MIEVFQHSQEREGSDLFHSFELIWIDESTVFRKKAEPAALWTRGARGHALVVRSSRDLGRGMIYREAHPEEALEFTWDADLAYFPGGRGIPRHWAAFEGQSTDVLVDLRSGAVRPMPELLSRLGIREFELLQAMALRLVELLRIWQSRRRRGR